jgi:MFS family permease
VDDAPLARVLGDACAVPHTAGHVKLPAPLRPLASRDFRVYWVGQAVSLVGTWMQQMAMGWVITRLTSRAVVLGALTLAASVPMATLAFKGGQLADKRSRRDILIVTQAILGLLALGLSVLAFKNAIGLPHLFAFSFLLGIATAFDLPAAQAFAPELVPPEDIPRAIALVQAIFHGSRLVGPALAGIAIERWGEGSAFLVNGLSFLAVIGSLLAIPRVREGRRGPPRGGGIGEGIAYVKSDATVKRLLILVWACALLAFPFLAALMPYYARYVVSADAAEMGRIMSTSGLGAVLGAGLLVVLGARGWRVRIGVGLVLITTGIAGLGFARSVGVATAFVTAFSLGVALYLGTTTQVMQQRVPNEVRGRVMALFMIGITAIMPISALILASLADVVGMPHLMQGAAVVFFVVTATIASSLREHPPRGAESESPRADAAQGP